MKSACSFVCVVFSPLHFQLPKQRAAGKGGSEELSEACSAGQLAAPPRSRRKPLPPHLHPPHHAQPGGSSRKAPAGRWATSPGSCGLLGVTSLPSRGHRLGQKISDLPSPQLPWLLRLDLAAMPCPALPTVLVGSLLPPFGDCSPSPHTPWFIPVSENRPEQPGNPLPLKTHGTYVHKGAFCSTEQGRSQQKSPFMTMPFSGHQRTGRPTWPARLSLEINPNSCL